MVVGMTSAMAATITINRDSTWQASSEEDRKATYTWHKIFDADLTDANHPVYTISGAKAADKVAVLPNIFTAELASDGKYYVTLNDGVQDAAVFSALATLVADHADLFPGTSVTSAADPVVLDVGTGDGYFFIKASNGKDVVIDTTGSKTITEKNDYPKIDKKQKRAADPTYTEAVIPAEIGKYIDYEVTVTVPADANKPIYVYDTMSAGLDYDETTGLTMSPNVQYSEVASTDTDHYVAGSTWQIKFDKDVVEANRGGNIVITYRALITEAALTDTGRVNEVTLKYDENNYVISDHVNYTTYFTGIEKVDGTDTDKKLKDVKFTLTANGAAFNVTKTSDGWYIPGGSSNEVVTDANGLIIIRGLDNTIGDYVLTETETNKGYNLLKDPKTLTLVEDTTTAYATDNFDQIENNQGAELPSTGGIGTTLFYIGGGILVLLAVVMLVTKRRMSSND